MKLTLHPTKPFVIAELGTSCDGSVGNMVELARHAVAAGASAIKVQCHFEQAEDMETPGEYPPWFQGARWEERRLYLQMQDCDLGTLKQHGPQVPLIVSAFSVRTVERIMRMPETCDAWKIASGQVTNHELIRACVETGKPIIVSSGMTTDDENGAAWKLIPREQLWCVMDCTSDYPTRAEHVVSVKHPAFTTHLAEWHGFSDHSPPGTCAAAIVALTRGARVFETHVCFDQRMYGSDSKNARTIEQFARYCEELDYASRISDREQTRDENVARLGSVREQFLVRTA